MLVKMIGSHAAVNGLRISISASQRKEALILKVSIVVMMLKR